MSLIIPEALWSIRPHSIAQAFPDRRGMLLLPDGVLRLPPMSRGFDEFRDWAPGRSVDLNYLMAFPEVLFDEDRGTWHVGVRTIRITPDEGMHSLMLAVAFAEEPGFRYTITASNIGDLVARSLSPTSETLPMRMLMSTFQSVTHMALLNMFYAPVLEATPGLTFRSIGDSHKKFNGSWHGHRFQVKVRGSQARLNIWAQDGSSEHPIWHAHVRYPEPLPLWEQISGDAPQAVHSLFTDLAASLGPTEATPEGAILLDFTVNRLAR